VQDPKGGFVAMVKHTHRWRCAQSHLSVVQLPKISWMKLKPIMPLMCVLLKINNNNY